LGEPFIYKIIPKTKRRDIKNKPNSGRGEKGQEDKAK
jgi:hypothetical protein